MSDRQFNAGERKDVRAKQKAARQAEVAHGEVIRDIASTTKGRAWLWNELAAANIFTSVFNENPIAMALNEGRRNAGLALMAQIMTWCPQQFVLMMQEHNTEVLADDANKETDNVETEE